MKEFKATKNSFFIKLKGRKHVFKIKKMCPATNFMYTLIKLMTNLQNKFYIEQQTNKTKIKESAFSF